MLFSPRNAREAGVTKFCRLLEEHRRTDDGRVKSARELLDTLFPHDERSAEDRIFRMIPREVRGPIVSGWGVRGKKSAIMDDDDRVRAVVHDALLAGDLDEKMFESGLSADVLIDWMPLADWWAFWRSGRIAGAPVQRALAFARELGLFDDKWFLDNVRGRGGRLAGTDIICDTLPKDQIIAWIRNLHASADGTPVGLVTSIGWETILAKTSQEALLYALDAFAHKVGLVAAKSSSMTVPSEVAIPEFSVSDMPPVPATESEWPDDPFKPGERRKA
jgi:hypothetical protein